VHLQGIHTLDISYCRKITPMPFMHMKGIHTLKVIMCQITDEGFKHLKGIHKLDIAHCWYCDLCPFYKDDWRTDDF